MLFQRPVFLSAICVLHAAPAAVICCGVTIYLMDKERRATLAHLATTANKVVGHDRRCSKPGYLLCCGLR